MEYQEFKIMIQERLQAMMGESVEIKIESYYKNNQTKVESLTFKEKNPVSKIIFSPAIHLQDIYRLYILHGDGEELADCLRQIQRLYEEQEPKSIKRFPEDWNEVKEQIFVHPISKKWNRDWLREGDVPFQEYLDFAIILRRNLKVTAHGTGSMVINRELISLMKVSEQKIWERAWKNLRHEKFFIQDINEAIRLESSAKEIKRLDFKGMPSMYVLSNKDSSTTALPFLQGSNDLMKEKDERDITDRFMSRLREGEWWRKDNELLNLHDINQRPSYYNGSYKELTTCIFLSPHEWDAIYNEYLQIKSNNGNSELRFYRNDEGDLRLTNVRKI